MGASRLFGPSHGFHSFIFNLSHFQSWIFLNVDYGHKTHRMPKWTEEIFWTRRFPWDLKTEPLSDTEIRILHERHLPEAIITYCFLTNNERDQEDNEWRSDRGGQKLMILLGVTFDRTAITPASLQRLLPSQLLLRSQITETHIMKYTRITDASTAHRALNSKKSNSDPEQCNRTPTWEHATQQL